MTNRIERIERKEDQTVLSEKALELKQIGTEALRHPPAEAHPSSGMRSIPQLDQAPSGNFDAEGQRPVLERSRKVR